MGCDGQWTMAGRPVKVYRCWQLWASQMRMSLLRSPEAYGAEPGVSGVTRWGDPFPPPASFRKRLGAPFRQTGHLAHPPLPLQASHLLTPLSPARGERDEETSWRMEETRSRQGKEASSGKEALPGSTRCSGLLLAQSSLRL